MDLSITPVFDFRWNDKDYQIVKAGILNGEAFAQTEPGEPVLEQILRERILKDNGLKIYHAFGYTCFIEEYEQK